MIQKEAQGNLDSSDDLYFLTLLPFYHLSSFMSVSGDSSKPIIVAIVANFVIAIAKTVGFFFSGSSALLSESIHSFADVMNQALLYIGIRREEKKKHPCFIMDTPRSVFFGTSFQRWEFLFWVAELPFTMAFTIYLVIGNIKKKAMFSLLLKLSSLFLF